MILLRKIKTVIAILYYLFFKKTNKNYINDTIRAINPNLKITLLDIGAAGDVEPRWKKIINFVNYIGFEPDGRSYQKLTQKNNNYFTIHNIGVWSYEGLIDINLCKTPQVSSFFQPNFKFLDLFPNKERFTVENNEKINVVTIDNTIKEEADFIKIDIQGGELEVLKGSTVILESALGLELEVEFVEMYQNQPLFGDICKYLESKNLQFIDFTNLCRWERNAHNGIGQNIFGDALFLKSPEYILSIYSDNFNKIERYLSILVLYRRYDLIEIVLNGLNEKLLNNLKYFIKNFEIMKKERTILLKFNSIFNLLLYKKIDLPIKSHIIY
jgi:FkbM family methyltransferase